MIKQIKKNNFNTSFLLFTIVFFGILIFNSKILTGEDEQLTATIIGSGSPRYNENRAGASVLITQGDTKFLVDMGNGTQANLNKLGINLRNLSALFFTHHHLDHNEEFVPILIRSLLGRHSFTVIGPPNTIKLTNTNIELYSEDISYRLSKSGRDLSDRKEAFKVRDILGGESFKIDNINISTLKVPHSIHTIAFRFDFKGKSIVITGDLTFSKDLSNFAKNADYLIIDSGGMRIYNTKGSKNRMRKLNRINNRGRRFIGQKRGKKTNRKKAHLNLSDSSLIAKLANIKNLVYTHFTPGNINVEASLKEIRKNYTGKVIFGEDLMVLNNTVKSY